MIDDIEMVQTSAGKTDDRLAPPENLKAKTQQRELELSWLPTAESGVSYEVKVNGKAVGTTTGTNFVVTQLAPGTSYNIEVVTLKNNTRSAKAATLNTATEALTHAVKRRNRIPYLYKVRENGTCPRALPLFWKELADANAKITYWVDDQQQEPTGRPTPFHEKWGAFPPHPHRGKRRTGVGTRLSTQCGLNDETTDNSAARSVRFHADEL